MKTTELSNKALAGERMLTGRFQSCTIEKTRTGTEYESTIIAGKTRNIDIKRWAKKGDKIGEPRFKFTPNSAVVLVGYSANVRDGYLDEQCDSIELIEK
jgi:hypothetical protein